jgi:N-acetyl-gamma-glutamyl-phosphate reductase
MHTHAAVFGASGYTGLEITKLLASHPSVELAVAASDRWQGDRVRDHLPVSGPAGDVHYRPPEAALDRAQSCQVAFLATPADTSVELVPQLLERGIKLIVDLSGGFRLKDPTLYPRYYGFAHPKPALLGEAVYGLPEVAPKDSLSGAQLIANPGCYPTAGVLAMAPLVSKGLCEPSIIVDAKSGVTGAGRKATGDLSFAEVDEDFRAYRVGKHQHGPEIAQSLAGMRNAAIDLTFTAHLLPVRRGILATCYAKLAPNVDPETVDGAVARFWEGARFVRHVAAEAVTLKAVVGTNLCLVAAKVDPATRMVTAFASIDNLIKGAAGQAVQNMNLALRLDEGLGLTDLKGTYP